MCLVIAFIFVEDEAIVIKKDQDIISLRRPDIELRVFY